MDKHILVIGSGSVGKRHMQNLSGLGCNISAIDPREDRLAEADELVGLVHQFSSLNQGDADWGKFDGVVVASPPNVHVEQTIAALESEVPTLLEKPICPDLRSAERLKAVADKHSNTPVLLGYTYRWWSPLHDFRKRLLNHEIGKPLHAKFVMSAHLADWHPWERYQDFFMSRKDLGGGALLDESHFLDLMLWFFGMPDSLYARVEKISDLEIDSDDNVDILASYESGLRVSIHLDLYRRPHEKYIKVSGNLGTVEWSFDPNRIRYSNRMGHDWSVVSYDLDRNDMFVELARDFLRMLDGSNDIRCTLKDGVDVLRVVEACRTSAEGGREVQI